MCGIAGAWSATRDKSDTAKNAVEKMAYAIQHRGPDDAGTWSCDENRLIMAHQRLSIQDLSALGHQPMKSASGRYVIVFNGEIYNFKKLTAELVSLGFSFRGHSDTEVMLAAFEAWGIEQSLDRLNGMFAFAAFDVAEKELWLARDRMGEKPLYYGIIDGSFYFCSELKGILKGINKRFNADDKALGHYFRYGYFASTDTPFSIIKKLPPACRMRLGVKDLNLSTDTESISRHIATYWQRPAASAAADASQQSDSQVLNSLEQRLASATHDQAIADVNVGVFLSGGIDSTLVAALLQKDSDRQINTYTIAFNSATYNEAPFAKDIAAHIGTNHTEIPVSIEACMDAIFTLPQLLDEPFADASILPTHLVCQAARKHVTVCLSGDGGDELFGGYNRYIQGSKMARLLSALPASVRMPFGQILTKLPENIIDGIYLPFARLLQASGKKPEKDIGVKLHKIARALTSRDDRELYATLLSFWHESPLTNRFDFPSLEQCIKGTFSAHKAFADSAMECDLNFYLVCDNLFKVDRAAMANSLEVRLPLLDRAIVEYAATLPLNFKIRNGQSKWALRQLLYRHVPRSLLDRPKMGFSVPLAGWLRNELYSWGEKQLMNSEQLINCKLNPALIHQTWKEHQSKRFDHSNALWTVLCYLQWYDANRSSIA